MDSVSEYLWIFFAAWIAMIIIIGLLGRKRSETRDIDVLGIHQEQLKQIEESRQRGLVAADPSYASLPGNVFHEDYLNKTSSTIS